MTSVLVVEDEKRLAAAIKRGLEAEGYAVDVALNGTDGQWLAEEREYDAIVLDIMLPGRDGYEVCGNLRNAGNWTPILMLTAKDGARDEVRSLDTGADDFLSKPFSFEGDPNIVEAYVRRLRKKADEPFGRSSITTKRGAGYRLSSDG